MKELLAEIANIASLILRDEYGVDGRCAGIFLLLDGKELVEGLEEAEVERARELIRGWEIPERLRRNRWGFLAAVRGLGGHWLLLWGLVRQGQPLPRVWDVWLGESRLPPNLPSRAAGFAHRVLEEMMRQGVVGSVEAPLHFGWGEEAPGIVRHCALAAADVGIPFPEGEVAGLLARRPGERGFGFVLRDDRLVWLVVEALPHGFTVVALAQLWSGGSSRLAAPVIRA